MQLFCPVLCKRLYQPPSLSPPPLLTPQLQQVWSNLILSSRHYCCYRAWYAAGRLTHVSAPAALQGTKEEEARELYTAAAEAGLAQEQPPAPEDRLTAAMQEQEQKLRVRFSALPLGL